MSMKNDQSFVFRSLLLIRKAKFGIAGTFFLIFQMVLIYEYIFLSDLVYMLWFCSHVSLFFAIGFFIRNIDLIKTFICIGLIPQFIWIIDYLVRLIFGFFLIGATDYMFEGFSAFSYATSFIAHFFSTGIALGLTYMYRPNKKILLYALMYLIIIFSLTLSLAPEEHNINLTQHMVISDGFTFPGYQAVLLAVAMLCIVLPSYYLQLYLYDIYGRSTHGKHRYGKPKYGKPKRRRMR